MLKIQLKDFVSFLVGQTDMVQMEHAAFGYFSYDADKFLFAFDKNMLLIDEPMKLCVFIKNNKHLVSTALLDWLKNKCKDDPNETNIKGIFLRPMDDREIAFKIVYTSNTELVGALIYSETSGTWGSHT